MKWTLCWVHTEMLQQLWFYSAKFWLTGEIDDLTVISWCIKGWRHIILGCMECSWRPVQCTVQCLERTTFPPSLYCFKCAFTSWMHTWSCYMPQHGIARCTYPGRCSPLTRVGGGGARRRIRLVGLSHLANNDEPQSSWRRCEVCEEARFRVSSKTNYWN